MINGNFTFIIYFTSFLSLIWIIFHDNEYSGISWYHDLLNSMLWPQEDQPFNNKEINPVSMVVADVLVPIWYQDICNHDGTLQWRHGEHDGS